MSVEGKSARARMSREELVEIKKSKFINDVIAMLFIAYVVLSTAVGLWFLRGGDLSTLL